MSVYHTKRFPNNSMGTVGDIAIYESESQQRILVKGKRGWLQTANLEPARLKLSQDADTSSMNMKGNLILNNNRILAEKSVNQGITLSASNKNVIIDSSNGLVVSHSIALAKASFSKLYFDNYTGNDYMMSTNDRIDTYVGGKHSIDVALSENSSGQINIYEATPASGTHHYIGFKAAAIMADSNIYKLPNAFPSGSSKVLQSTTAGVLSWVSDTNTITALNNATANELVTVGSTTTELDAEANLTFDGTDLAIAALGKIYFDGGGNTYIAQTADDILSITVGGVEMIKITEASADTMVFGGGFSIPVTKRIGFDGGLVGTYITESSDDILDFYVGADKMLSLDEANDKIIIGATNWVAGTVSEGTVTEFSATNSAYAGMILGYTRIQDNSTNPGADYITINSSTMTVLQTAAGTDLSIQFIVPPSGNVEIDCKFFVQATSDGARFSLSTGSSYAELGETHTYDADTTFFIDESDHYVVSVVFAVTGLTAGTDTTYYLAGFATGASTFIRHGRFRTTGLHSPPIILKAIALPATIVTGE